MKLNCDLRLPPQRAVEASMADTKGGSTHRYDSLLLHIDPVNPHERIRDGANPVGIKNVGNTCWFSAVVQVDKITIKLD